MTLLFRTDWMYLQKHEEDFKNVCKELGFLNKEGKIQRFSGPQFWPKFEALGHSSSQYELCKCQRPHKCMTIEDMKKAGIPTSEEELDALKEKTC